VAVLTNRAAVHFEMKDYVQCISDCKQAIEDGRTFRADWKIVARAYERMGNALMKQDKIEEAIKAYQDSLLENRTRDVEKKLKDAEKLLKTKKEQDYINPEIAAQEKEKGNTLVKDGKFVEAKAVYDEAIKRNPKDHTLYSNRALCYSKLMEWPAAKADCDKVCSCGGGGGGVGIKKRRTVLLKSVMYYIVYAHTCTNVYVLYCICTHMHKRVRIILYMHTHAPTCTYYIVYAHTCTNVYVLYCICTHMHKRVRIILYMHTHAQTCTCI
jgi:hypothetical protein